MSGCGTIYCMWPYIGLILCLAVGLYSCMWPYIGLILCLAEGLYIACGHI